MKTRTINQSSDKTAEVRSEITALDVSGLMDQIAGKILPGGGVNRIRDYVADCVAKTRIKRTSVGDVVIENTTLPDGQIVNHTWNPITGRHRTDAPSRRHRPNQRKDGGACPFCDETNYGPGKSIYGDRNDPVALIRNTHPRGQLGIVSVEGGNQEKHHLDAHELPLTVIFERNAVCREFSCQAHEIAKSDVPRMLSLFGNRGGKGGSTILHSHTQAELTPAYDASSEQHASQVFDTNVGLLKDIIREDLNLLGKSSRIPVDLRMEQITGESAGDSEIAMGLLHREVQEYFKLIGVFSRDKHGVTEGGPTEPKEIEAGLGKLLEKLGKREYKNMHLWRLNRITEDKRTIAYESENFVVYCPRDGEADEINIRTRSLKTNLGNLDDDELLELATLERQIALFYHNEKGASALTPDAPGWNLRIDEVVGRREPIRSRGAFRELQPPLTARFFLREKDVSGHAVGEARVSSSVEPEETAAGLRPYLEGLEEMFQK